MLDAICHFANNQTVSYTVFKFQKLSDAEIEKLRQALSCPACGAKAYYRKASSDGKAACFGSRYHEASCKEFRPSVAKEWEEQHALEVNRVIADNEAMIIDFSQTPKAAARGRRAAKGDIADASLEAAEVVAEQGKPGQPSSRPAATQARGKHEAATDEDKRIVSQGLEKLLHSLMRGSDLAESDLWVYTDDKYRWRAKNLFVNFADAEPTEKGAPRMYWGTISHADKENTWLNPADCKDVGIPIDGFSQALLQRFEIGERRDLEGAGLIVFGKCFWNKSKTRKIIQLWDNDIRRIFISKAEE